MEHITKVHLPFSKKNIPVPPNKEYFKKSFAAISSLCMRMAWFVAIQLSKDESGEVKEELEYYGFKSGRAPPPEGTAVVQNFTNKLMNLFTNVTFRRTNNSGFQLEMKEWLSNITSENKVIVPADKTRNYYQLSLKEYDKLLTQNVSKEYKKAASQMVQEGNSKAKKLVKNIGEQGPELIKRMEIHSSEPCFITLKDHKEDFRQSKSLECRLIKPSKSDLGKISKRRLETITQIVREKTKYNQWQSNIQVKSWFKGVKNKSRMNFISFDIEGFYPAITPLLLDKSINWANKFVKISQQDRELFREARRSFLYHHETAYVKKKNPQFDVAMGAYDGAEACELVGLYLLEEIIKANIGLRRELLGLYRDDGLAMVRDRERIDPLVKALHGIFKRHSLSIKIKHSLKSVDFLDLTLHLQSGEYEPFRKEDNIPIYVNRGSNHPPNITNHIPRMIEKMVSDNSSSKAIFDKHKKVYSEALRQSGYDGRIQYVPQKQTSKKKKQRWPSTFYFNPPYNCSVKTKVGKKFLKIVEECFPKGSTWSRFFNRHTVKLSYSCTKNVASKISQHNNKVMNQSKPKENAGCNCRNPNECPIPGDCLSTNVVYQALIDSEIGYFNYFGLTANTFKERYRGHKYDLAHRESNGTTLSNKVWQLRDANKKFTIKWSIIDRAYPRAVGAKSCDLCSAERMHIAMGTRGFKRLPEGCILLNKRQEIMAKCRHKRKYTLAMVGDQ